VYAACRGSVFSVTTVIPSLLAAVVYLAFALSTVMLDNLHFAKALSPILSTDAGIVIDFKLMQSLNAFSPILFIPFLIITVVKPAQSQNAPSIIVVTELGIVIEVKPA
jgi:hypothetical protein